MFSHCTDYMVIMPSIVVFINCDTSLAINLSRFNLGENDELIFTIKNYNYKDSGYIYMYRARKAEMDKNGEVIFKITPEVSKQIKPGAFYNFSIMTNVFNPKMPTVYKKLTGNGPIALEYGAQDLLIKPSAGEEEYTIDSIRLEPVSEENTNSTLNPYMSSRLVGMRLEEV